jgi:predicted peroxiredoxin
MNKYLLIESSDPFQRNGGYRFFDLAADLLAEGHEVVLFLVQNAVLGARTNAASTAIAKAVLQGVAVFADDFSLRERGIQDGRLQANVEPVGVDFIVDKLAEGYKALWH